MTARVVDSHERTQRFEVAVAYCRKLQQAGHLISGVEFYIAEDGRISARPMTSEADEGAPSIPDMTGRMLRAIQQMRHTLGAYFNVASDEWNTMPIGQMLTTIESGMRSEHYTVEEYE